jgi:tetratricopeptide (TPR) repeat protein
MGPGYGANEPDLSGALSALRAGDLDAADAIARRLLADTPNDPAVLQLAAVVALQRGELEQAARAASASLGRRPDHVPTLIIAGRAARASADLAAAAAFFGRAMALAPKRADAAFGACVTLLERGDPEAQALLPRLLAQFPDDGEGWRNLAAALQKAGQPEAALVALTRAAQAVPSVALHLQRGMLLESLDRRVDAIAAYRAATDMAPDNADALFKLGLCLRRCAETDAAAVMLERAVGCDRNSADAWFALALVRQDQGDLAAAAEAYQRALDIRLDFAEAAVNLGTCYQEIGDVSAAKANYRLALQLKPETFGRIAQALAASPVGEVWLDIAALRKSLGG